MSQPLDRFIRQKALKEVGEEGQEKLKKTSVLIVGLGGLGCNCSLQLALSGVGMHNY
jgi:molybdopterin/thiamine biosynthesis adenylyltransferase